MLFTTYAGMDMGRDKGGVVDEAHADRAGCAFAGALRKVVLDRQPMSLEDELALHLRHRHAAVEPSPPGST